MTLDASGNLGIGVTPNTWTAAWRAIELATSGSSIFSNGSSSIALGQGFYNNSGSKYAQASYAVGGYQINAGVHQFLIAAAGTVGAAVTFTTAMTLDASGNLGIGTTSPAQKLDVKGVLQLTNSTTPANTSYVYDGGGLLLASNNSNPMYFYTGAAESMRITSSGNVGIGTDTPLSKLEVRSGYITAGSTSATGGPKILAGYYTTSTGHITTLGSEYSYGGPVLGYGVWPSTSAVGAFVSSDSSNLYRGAYTINSNQHIWYGGAAQTVAVGSAVTTSELMRIDTRGNVGIGVVPNTWTTAWRAIELATSGSSVFSNGSSSIALGQGFYNNSGSKYAQASYAVGGYQINAGVHQFLIAAAGTVGAAVSFTQAMTLDASGNLLVGTTASAGDITNTAPIVAGVFKTLSGTVSAASATATTIATLPSVTNGTYIVSCGLPAADPTNYSAVSLVSVDSTVLRITSLQTAVLMSISVSGQTVRATQGSGITQPIYFTLTRVS
jgi:hypothetical protein